MPTRTELEAAAAHVYHVAPRTADPAEATARFAAAPWPAHEPLEIVRRYYSQVAYAVARGSYRAGASLTRSATGGMLAFQLTAAALTATGLALVVTAAAIECRGRRATAMLGCATAAVATTPAFLSLSRQVLTETVGFPLLVATVVLAGVAVRSGRWATVLGGLVGGLAFATVRTRYSFGPTLAALLAGTRPCGPPLKGRGRPVVAALLAVAACVAVDRLAYGAFVYPWTYDDLLVRSTRLYFHSGPEPFWVAAYVNWPLLVLPVVVVATAVVKGPRGVWAMAATVVFAALLVGTARQSVGYQPRHLFAVAGGMAVVLLRIVGQVRWSRRAAEAFAGLCAAVAALNVYSTLGPQRTTMAVEFPPTVAERLRSEPVGSALLHGYFDPADNRRLHDVVVVLDHVGRTPGATLAVDPAADSAYRYAVLAPPGGPAVVVREATSADAFAVAPPGKEPAGRWERTAVSLDRGALFRRVPG